MLAAYSFTAGCGGDDSADGASSDVDRAFVTGLCQEVSALSAGVEKSLAGPTPADLGEAIEQLFSALVEPMQGFADGFGKLTPPEDLADWHKNTATQLAAAAKALKAGRFDDPSLESLSKSPIPDMPEAARKRLEAIAATMGACKADNPFETSTANGSGGTLVSEAPTPALKDAASGTWTGKFGTLTFNPDGSGKFDIKNCGIVSPSDAPFGATDTCDPDSYSGKVEVGTYQYILRSSNGVGSIFDAYVDKDGRLHVGIGTVSPFGPGQKGSIKLFASGTLNVDGGTCTMQSFSNSKDRKPVTCRWSKEDGKDVLEFDNGFNGTDKVVILPDEGLAVSPNIYVAAFDKKK
jgi:hypothetical protein